MTRLSTNLLSGLLTAARTLQAHGRPGSERHLRWQALISSGDVGSMWPLLQEAQKAGDIENSLTIYRSLSHLLKQQIGPAALEMLNRLSHEPIAALHIADAPSPPPSSSITSVPKRVAYLLNYALPQVTNGYTLRAQAISNALKHHGIDLVCLTRPGFPLDRSPPQAFRPIDQVDGIAYLHEALPILDTFSNFSTYLTAATNALEGRLRSIRPHAVVAASNFQIALPSLIAARRLGLPFYYEVRGFWELTQLAANPSIETTLFYQLQHALECRVARHANHVFTLAPSMREELQRRGVASRQISLVPNGCDTKKFSPQPRNIALAAHYNIPADVPVIGYIGSLVQYEGLDDLIHACTLLQARDLDFRLLLVGSGPAENSILKVAANSRLEEKLILLGRIPHEEVEAHYSLIDIAPFPRKSQRVTELVPPLKPLEAMAMEKAVIVSSVRPLADMILNNKTGLVFKKNDTEDLARTIVQLISDPDLRVRLGRAGRVWVETERNWKTTTAPIAKIVTELMG